MTGRKIQRMEPNMPVAKKMWKLVRVVLFMLRKGISKRKLMVDLNMLLKRGKNLMFHHGGVDGDGGSHFSGRRGEPLKEYEFSCSNTPTNYNYSFLLSKKKRPEKADDGMAAVRAVMEILNSSDGICESGTAEYTLTAPLTPYLLPGFGQMPLQRPLRITDSPFPIPLREEDGDDGDSSTVDKAAEEFIQKVRRSMRRQKKMVDCVY